MQGKMFARALCIAFMIICVSAESSSDDTSSAGFKTIMRVFDECHKSAGGMTPCFKKKAITFIDRLARIDKFPISEGVFVIKSSEMSVKSVSENELESTLPRGLEERDETLTNLLLQRIVAFFNSRTIQLSFPKMDTEELGRSLEEGRGKMKKMMGMMGMGFAMKMAALIPIAIAGLFVLAGKALITAKIALLLSGIIALKKLLAQKNSGHESHGWSSGGSGGWDRRSISQSSPVKDEAQKLAYNSYFPQ